MANFKVGDKIRILVNRASEAPVIAGQILTITDIREHVVSAIDVACQKWGFATFGMGIEWEPVNLYASTAKTNDTTGMTLPTDSKVRKEYPIASGCIRYFPAALAGVAKTSKLGNDKHNPGEALHHARGKSMDHADCILRHLIDLEDLLALKDRGAEVTLEQILGEASSLAWRALALSQELHEKLGVAPLAPGAKESK